MGSLTLTTTTIIIIHVTTITIIASKENNLITTESHLLHLLGGKIDSLILTTTITTITLETITNPILPPTFVMLSQH